MLATETVLDAAVLVQSACETERQFRSELCIDAGIQALGAIAECMGIVLEPPGEDPGINLPRETFDAGCRELAESGVPMRPDGDAAWRAFRHGRARYEPVLSLLGAITFAPRSDWSAWSDDTPHHNPPLLRIHSPGS